MNRLSQLQADKINAENEFRSLENRIRYAEESGVYSRQELRMMYYDSEQVQHRITWMSRFIAFELERASSPLSSEPS